MHDVICMRCGKDADWLYRSKNPDWADWDLCERCLKECDAELLKDIEGEQNKKEGD